MMMRILNRILSSLKRDARGVTALEYGLIAAVIGGVVITAATSFGNSIETAYNNIGSALTNTTAGL
jgi:pilus assembly protein Flp/PilA